MPDITKCKGVNCPKKEDCYRFKAEPSIRQSYFADTPYKFGKCDYFWITNEAKLNTKKKPKRV